jgi:hypothetical protein
MDVGKSINTIDTDGSDVTDGYLQVGTQADIKDHQTLCNACSGV